MPTYKITYKFAGGNTGWSEQWYRTTSSHSACMLDAMNVADWRIQLLGVGARIDTVVVSDDAIKGDGLIASPAGEGAPSPSQAGGARDTNWNCWEVRVYSTPLYFRAFFTRGMPDDWLVYNTATQGYPANAVFLTRLSNFFNAAIARGFQMKCVNKAADVVGNAPITSMVFAGNYITITAAGHNLAVNDKVRITPGKYVGGIDPVRGIYNVHSVAGATFTVAFTTPDVLPVYQTGAKAAKRAVLFANIDGHSLQRPAWRKTGRPFFAPVGRRRKRRTFPSISVAS